MSIVQCDIDSSTHNSYVREQGLPPSQSLFAQGEYISHKTSSLDHSDHPVGHGFTIERLFSTHVHNAGQQYIYMASIIALKSSPKVLW